jgi:hypothetical protein
MYDPKGAATLAADEFPGDLLHAGAAMCAVFPSNPPSPSWPGVASGVGPFSLFVQCSKITYSEVGTEASN